MFPYMQETQQEQVGNSDSRGDEQGGGIEEDRNVPDIQTHPQAAGASAEVDPAQIKESNEMAVDPGVAGKQITSADVHCPERDDEDGVEIQVDEQQPLIQH